ncbi:LysM peptidoglycan-binding domain-containing protein [Pseudomonas aeruginosa]|uniref:LysM peptidoglycan-binding domain-containing protein n=1 Tax=Pseudomonas aeruginosa TaxID=287 RepID=UPI002042F982|nr:hypothetical protein [Pseudomonas aeruginosa]MCM4075457.1 hypothetical protein [Pseudomonas aeruginosa]MCM4094331.1 hypothetical protein [Pseudomonas aeruginosa]MCM4108052.1 hypothetical protein [Pseudomonas aeruginosa]MCM4121332.1 hypothetical protein [Pseudomonas aeruginosa]
MNKALDLLRGLVSEVERKTCCHEETHRGGAIWEICDSCGAKWADDEGGKPEFAWPESVEKARAFLATHPPVEQAGGDERASKPGLFCRDCGSRLMVRGVCSIYCPNCVKAQVKQAGGDERAAFELFVRKHCGMPEHIAVNWDAKFTNDAWEGWQARAALAQPSPAPADEKPGDSILCSGCFAKGVGPEHFDEAGKCLVRQQTEPLGAEFAQVLSDNLPELLSTAQVKQAEAERPEVVAVARIIRNDTPQAFMAAIPVFDTKGPFEEGETLMKVAQHERIAGALRAERDAALARVAELEGKLTDWVHEGFRLNEALAMACDAASKGDAARHAAGGMEMEIQELKTKLAELEKQEPVAWMHDQPNRVDVIHRDVKDLLQRVPGSSRGIHRPLDVSEHYTIPLYAGPVAQAQQLHDLDKQCRDDVARALGLRPNQERGFAWSYLLASIKSCVKASGDSAQAQHSVPAYVSYTTQPAESLAGIALRQLKDESRWVEIRDINAHAFPDMRSHSYYPAGTVIKLPAAAPGKEVGHE